MASQWYVIHAQAGQEQNVKDHLERLVDSPEGRGFISSVLVPSERVVEVKRGKRRVMPRKFFPGYVLVEMELNDDSWYLIKSTPGVTGFVGAGRRPVPLKESEMEAILEQIRQGAEEKPRPKVTFEQGERVKIIEGPFTNLVGTVDEVDLERGKLRVLVEIFERLTAVELEFWQVEKM